MSTSLASRRSQYSERWDTAQHSPFNSITDSGVDVSLSQVWGATWSSDSAIDNSRTCGRRVPDRRRVRVSSYDSRRPRSDQPRQLAAAVQTPRKTCKTVDASPGARGLHSYSHGVGEMSMRAVIGGIVGIGLFFGGLGAIIFDDTPAESLPQPSYVSFSIVDGQ